MRVAPVGLYMNRCMENMTDQMKDLDLIAAETAAITHGHPLGYMPTAALAHIINRIVYWNMSVEEAVRDVISAMREVFKNQAYLEEMVALMEKAIRLANNDVSDTENVRELGEGWEAEETLSISIYCSVRYADNFSKSIITAVNHDGDSDSTGAVTGNIVGAAVGYENIPDEWKEYLECLEVILEVAGDLCHDCQMEEYRSYRDPEWEAKYIYMKVYQPEIL